MTLQHSLMRTWCLPLFSVLWKLLKASARTFIRTMVAAREYGRKGQSFQNTSRHKIKPRVWVFFFFFQHQNFNSCELFKMRIYYQCQMNVEEEGRAGGGGGISLSWSQSSGSSHCGFDNLPETRGPSNSCTIGPLSSSSSF